LAAYLHDIGKGPKERWAGNGGIQKVDVKGHGYFPPPGPELFSTSSFSG
jgi:hypothetical protein